MKQIAVRVDDELLAAIEAARGELPRERWMRAALAAASGLSSTAEPPRQRKPGVMAVAPSVQRGSPSPSLERFSGPRPKGGKR